MDSWLSMVRLRSKKRTRGEKEEGRNRKSVGYRKAKGKEKNLEAENFKERNVMRIKKERHISEAKEMISRVKK